MFFKMGGAGGVDVADKPQISFDGKWSGWHIEVYEGEPYWEALFSTSGTLVSLAQYTADLWGIGGGGAGGNYSNSYSGGIGTGGGSGFTNMVESTTISAGGHAVTIGAGGTSYTSYNVNTSDAYYKGAKGGTTSFLTLSCTGGYGGCTSSRTSGGTGGSNGSVSGNGGANGSPGAGKIMSKFWSTEHNTEYGAGGTYSGEWSSHKGGGGGGYLDVGATDGTQGHGYGGGGGGHQYANVTTEYHGKSGCLVIRIKI